MALIIFACIVAVNIIQAQTLFTYGDHAVSKNEFLEAYNKNADPSGNRQEKLKAYLDQYINFRLKLQAAYDEKLDTNEELKAEMKNFKSQLADNFINKQANLAGLMQEAFLRGQKDILAQQVFVRFEGNDTGAAYKQISQALKELKAGKDFEKISVQYSNVQAVKDVIGNIGYITVFTLPYSIENIIYNLKPGNFSEIYRSGQGYHIFKNAGERPAAGRRKIQQLLFATPSLYSVEQLNRVKKQADSVYSILQNGASFTSFLPLYGHNYDEEADNAIEVGTGNYSNDFEKEVFDLKAAGDISRPFKTAYGYNIIKLLEILPVPSNEGNATYEAYLQTQMQNSGRLDAAKNKLVETWLSTTGFKKNDYEEAALWAYTDSALKNNGKLFVSHKIIRPEMVLFQFAGKKITVKDWIGYLKSKNISGIKALGYGRQMDDFIRESCSEYYRKHIEDFDSSVPKQLKEFNEANMLFYIMDKNVWSKASRDSAGLKNCYVLHKDNYMWKQSVIALVISAPEKNIAKSIASKIKSSPSQWRNIAAAYGNGIYADSSRFNINELPVKTHIEYENGFQTMPESNDEGNVYTFIHVLSYNREPEQKSFEEARGAVINDYQEEIEKSWIKSLKSIYPVRVHENTFKMLH
ncbi:peptidylprolyl isomerase [Parafilimonas sp.]|uniref:peptidylprolyl isomerase n=1 Tax=Parafilimonas sp. TaxID=1969739 RepID=UPI0039E42A03